MASLLAARFILLGSAIAVVVWGIGGGLDVVRFLTVLVTLVWAGFLAFLFLPRAAESFEPWREAQASFEIGGGEEQFQDDEDIVG